MVVGHVQFFFQTGDALGGGGVHLVVVHFYSLGVLDVRAQEDDGRHARAAAQFILDGLGDDGDIFGLVVEFDRDLAVGHLAAGLPGFLEDLGNNDLEVCPDQGEDVQGNAAQGDPEHLGAVSVGVGQIVLIIHDDAGRHEGLQDLGVQFILGIGDVGLFHGIGHIEGVEAAVKVVHGIGDPVVDRRPARSVVDKDLLIGAQDPEDIIIIDDGLGPAQEEVALVLQGHMENSEQLTLQDALEIDQQVPAADQVQLAEGRILEDIVLGKDDHLADLVVDHIMVPLAGEIAAEPGDRHIFDDVVPVHAPAGGGDGVGVQVGSEDLDLAGDAKLVHGLGKKDGDGIGFLTGGTAGDPDPDLV